VLVRDTLWKLAWLAINCARLIAIPQVEAKCELKQGSASSVRPRSSVEDQRSQSRRLSLTNHRLRVDLRRRRV
jgi:hypothetical protein